MDRAAANLEKLEGILTRATSFIPRGPSRGSPPEYDDLCRAWRDLLPGLPPIDGWTVTDPLPDIDGLGQAYIDYLDGGEPPFSVDDAGEKPAKDLAEYRYRLGRARRRAVQERLEELTALIESSLSRVVANVAPDSRDRVAGDDVDGVAASFDEIERLIADTVQRTGRWGDLRRHLRFGQGCDWHDIQDHDWPTVRVDIEAAAWSESDPLPVPDIDLGAAAAARPTGAATLALPWERLDDEGFERLLYDLLRAFPDNENVQWLMHTRAPDRGRDISMDRVLRDGAGGVRNERVIVQAKHWRTRSVNVADVSTTMTAVQLWQPPVVRGLIIATTGRFSADAVEWVEQHNESGTAPFIELWPDSRLETLLAQKPQLAAAHGLR